jgi:lipid-A-disaccharide synthase-like uncharacterized protein
VFNLAERRTLLGFYVCLMAVLLKIDEVNVQKANFGVFFSLWAVILPVFEIAPKPSFIQ